MLMTFCMANFCGPKTPSNAMWPWYRTYQSRCQVIFWYLSARLTTNHRYDQPIVNLHRSQYGQFILSECNMSVIRGEILARLCEGISGLSIASVMQLRAIKKRIVKSNCFVPAMHWHNSRNLSHTHTHTHTHLEPMQQNIAVNWTFSHFPRHWPRYISSRIFFVPHFILLYFSCLSSIAAGDKHEM